MSSWETGPIPSMTIEVYTTTGSPPKLGLSSLLYSDDAPPPPPAPSPSPLLPHCPSSSPLTRKINSDAICLQTKNTHIAPIYATERLDATFLSTGTYVLTDSVLRFHRFDL